MVRTTTVWCLAYHKGQFNVPRVDQLHRTATALFRGGYHHRELFVAENRVLATYSPRIARALCHHMHDLLDTSFSLYSGPSGRGPLCLGSVEDTRLVRRLCMHMWYYRMPEDRWRLDYEEMLLRGLQILYESSEDELFDFVDHDIAKMIGASNFMASLTLGLRNDSLHFTFYQRLFPLLLSIIDIYMFWPHYSSSGFFAALRSRLDSLSSVEPFQLWVVLGGALHNLRCVLFARILCDRHRYST